MSMQPQDMQTGPGIQPGPVFVTHLPSHRNADGESATLVRDFASIRRFPRKRSHDAVASCNSYKCVRRLVRIIEYEPGVARVWPALLRAFPLHNPNSVDRMKLGIHMRTSLGQCGGFRCSRSSSDPAVNQRGYSVYSTPTERHVNPYGELFTVNPTFVFPAFSKSGGLGSRTDCGCETLEPQPRNWPSTWLERIARPPGQHFRPYC
jgi:hypothetical protein